ncbi:hypothetical protein NQ314_003125 [Rhamnusium bicolor]|uniref:PABS domain-containing protein n=1 Tax=Rhamnusium bicolor TaxID=1586634 RepID=A0AAV8ZQG4_9CUCU|nr:hypothetical protein NQ314_003125 [Rhamnusium bicolor]
MSVNTILLDFSVDPNSVKNESQLPVVAANFEGILRDYLTNLKPINSFNISGGLVRIYTSDPNTTVTLRVYDHGLITVSIEYLKGDKQEPILSYERCKELEQDVLGRVVDVKKTQSFAPLKRGTYMTYYVTSDIAESDLIYTETLMCRGKENYKGKEIVILGGGDGALLYELLKEEPKEVIMLEIDEVVMKACAKYMRSICGEVLDDYEGDNYKIIVGDCMKSLEQYITEGRKFDYIFGDLTDIPISESLSGQLWTFVNKVLQMSFKVLKPDGKFMTHLNGSSSPESIDMYKSQLEKIEPPVKFTTSKAFVPSFMEVWVFCQVSFDRSKNQ